MNKIRLTKTNSKQVIDQALMVLRSGGLVIYPTETCYGIGADATNAAAIERLLKYKTKRKDKPFSIAVTDKKMAAKYVFINKTAKNIYDNFLPGPITIISKGKHKVAPGVESSMGTQGIRVPNYPLVLELVKQYKKPITATSANASYKKVPYTIADVLNNISQKQKSLVGLIIDAGRLPKRKPSTIVDTTLDNIYILREGSLEFKSPRAFLAEGVEKTTAFVDELYEKLLKFVGKKNIVFLLQGELGAGKTYFTKSLAKKLGIKNMIVSPTFTLCNEYRGRVNKKQITLNHMDTYRMFDPSEIDELHPEQLFRAPNITVIEWANKVSEYIQKYLQKSVVVKIRILVVSDNTRRFEYEIQ